MFGKFFKIGCFLGLVAFFLLFNMRESQSWGFWAHKRINRLAVFTLPPEMIVFYKTHLEYVTEHAVDPDKRLLDHARNNAWPVMSFRGATFND